MFKITKSIVISLSFALFTQFPISGMYNGIDPNADGCIQDAKTEKYRQEQTLEATFAFDEYNGTITEMDFYDFSSEDKNAYKIKAIPCLRQPVSGPCGFYSVFHLSQLYKGQSLLNRDALDRLYSNNNAYQQSVSYEIASCSKKMQNIVDQKMNYFTNNNFTIANGGKEANREISTERTLDMYGNIISETTRDSDRFLDRVRKFQQNGTSQYLVISGDANATIPDVTLDWNTASRPNCLRGHWMAIKLHGQVQLEKVLL